MDFKLEELRDVHDVIAAYDVYRHCMYLPTRERYMRKMKAYMMDDSIKTYACVWQGKIVGVSAAKIGEDGKVELVGISVDSSLRGRGAGTFMVRKIMDVCDAKVLLAETDDDAVGFYRKAGFSVSACVRCFEGEYFKRYICILKRD